MSKERPQREVKLENQETPAEELTPEQAEQVQGGAWYAKFDGVDGVSLKSPDKGQAISTAGRVQGIVVDPSDPSGNT